MEKKLPSLFPFSWRNLTFVGEHTAATRSTFRFEGRYLDHPLRFGVANRAAMAVPSSVFLSTSSLRPKTQQQRPLLPSLGHRRKVILLSTFACLSCWCPRPHFGGILPDSQASYHEYECLLASNIFRQALPTLPVACSGTSHTAYSLLPPQTRRWNARVTKQLPFLLKTLFCAWWFLFNCINTVVFCHSHSNRRNSSYLFLFVYFFLSVCLPLFTYLSITKAY